MTQRGAAGVLSTLILTVTLSSACGSDIEGPTGTPFDDTARQISPDELSRMVLELVQYGTEFQGFTPDPEQNEPLTIDRAADREIDPADARVDLEAGGFESGYEKSFSDERALEAENGVFRIGSVVYVFNSVAGANTYFDSELAAIAEDVGKSREGVTLRTIERFDTNVAAEASGRRSQSHYDEAQTSEWLALTEEELQELEDLGIEPVTFDFSSSAVMFRHGRLVGNLGFLAIALPDAERERLEGRLRDFARKMNDQVTEVLTPSAPTTATP